MNNEQPESNASKAENNQAGRDGKTIEEGGEGERSIGIASAGFCFIAISLVCLGSIIYLLVTQPHEIALSDHQRTFGQLVFAAYIKPLVLFASATFSVTVGYVLLRTSRILPGILPRQDRELLMDMLNRYPEDGFANYLKLRESSGSTAFLGKLHLSGLPLATIGLTVLFTFLGLFVPALFDLARLTAGAFIGSYVQRQTNGQQP